jgi:hypothetical protein
VRRRPRPPEKCHFPGKLFFEVWLIGGLNQARAQKQATPPSKLNHIEKHEIFAGGPAAGRRTGVCSCTVHVAVGAVKPAENAQTEFLLKLAEAR